MHRGLIVLLGLALLQGCASSYEPARSPRIVTIVEGGQPTFVKNGERIGGPVFGTGLADAVAGVPEAEHHAIVGRNLVLGGFILDLAGLGSVIGGTVVLANQDPGEEKANAASSALLIGGLVAVLAGSVMMISGQPHIYDAVNIYNDSLDARPTPAPPQAGTPPSAAAPPLGPRASFAAGSTAVHTH